MRNERLVPGVILVIIGGIFLLYNFGYLDFHWENFAVLWPLFIIVPGVLLLLASNRSAWANILRVALIVGGVALLLFGNLSGKYRWWRHVQYYNSSTNDDNDDNDDDNPGAKVINIKGDGEFKEAYKTNMRIAQLNIAGGAATYRLTDTTADLFKADSKGFNGKFEYNSRQEDSTFVMDFKMKSHGWNWHDDSKNNDNRVNLSLNTRPEWKLDIGAGATDLNFDLSKYKVRSVDLSGGAGQFVLKMGQPLTTTNIEISAGAADVTIDIPKDAACQIESSTGLSSTDFDGFNKKEDGYYETTGFDAAKNKMYIHISGAISDFKVHKY